MKPMPRKNDVASVFGLGRSGRALITHLVREGVRVKSDRSHVVL